MSTPATKSARPAAARYERYPAYKDSGVPWLGPIPAHWDAHRLKLVAPLRSDRADRDANETYVGLENIQSWTGLLQIELQPESVDCQVTPFRHGDVLLGKLRPNLAKAARPNFAGGCSTEILVLRPVPGNSQSYVMYSLLDRGFINWLDSLTFGARMPRVAPDQVADSPIATPPPGEQRAIARFLDRETARIDALSAKNERLIALLQEKRTALITRAVTQGLDPSVPMKDSGVPWLGEIPAHWGLARLKRAARTRYGLSEPPPLAPEGLAFIRATNIARGRITEAEMQFIDPAEVPKGEPSLLAGEVIVVRSGAYTGDSAITPPEYCGSIAGYDMVVTPRSVLAEFLGWSLLSPYVLEAQIALEANRAAQPHLTSEDLGNVALLQPPAHEQRAIAAFLDRETARLDALTAKVRLAIARLHELRIALVSAAVTGQIDVRSLDEVPA